MKNVRHLFLILILAILLLPVAGWGATYYVKATGNNSLDGLSPAKAWQTVSKVNGTTFSSGDTVLFNRGDTWTDAGIKINNTLPHNFTISAYGSGARPWINGNYHQPIHINPTSSVNNLTISHIDISGADWQVAKDSNVDIKNINGLVLDDIYGDGWGGGATYAKSGVTVWYCTGTIQIKNSTLLNWGTHPIVTSGADYMALALLWNTSGTILVDNNVIYDITSDGVHTYYSTASTTISNNTIYNCGENSIDEKGSSNVTITGNSLYRDASFTGDAGSGGASLLVIHDPGTEGGVTNVDVYKNSFQVNDVPGISLQDYVTNVRIHENTFTSVGSNIGTGISVSDNHDALIYRNSFTGVRGSIKLNDVTDGVSVYYNLIVNPRTYISGGYDLGGISENTTGANNIYNNTIYNGTGTAVNLIASASSVGSRIKNNIGYQGLSGTTNYPLLVATGGAAAVVNNNIWYGAGNQGIKYRNTVYKNIATWIAAGHAGESFSNPLFISASDYRLQSSSPAVNAGVNTGLTTDYSGTTVPQGSAPDIGAYESISYISPKQPSPPANILLQ